MTFSLVNNYGKSDHSSPDDQHLHYRPPHEDADDDQHYHYRPQHEDGDSGYQEESLNRDDGKLEEISDDETFLEDDVDNYHVEVGYHGLEALDADFHDDGDQFGLTNPGDETGEFG